MPVRDRPLNIPLIELLPGLLGATVGYNIGFKINPILVASHHLGGAVIGFLVGLAFVALAHWGVSR